MKKGFTLIELLVVVLIIGILSAVAMPQYEKAVWKSRTSQLYTSVRSLATAQESYFMANGTYATDFASLDIGFDGLQASGSSSLGVSTSSNDSVRYNDHFEMSVNKSSEFTLSLALFKKGSYKGGGIGFPHETTTSGIKNREFYCIELTSYLTAGDFCKKVMGLTGTPVTAYSARYYLIN